MALLHLYTLFIFLGGVACYGVLDELLIKPRLKKRLKKWAVGHENAVKAAMITELSRADKIIINPGNISEAILDSVILAAYCDSAITLGNWCTISNTNIECFELGKKESFNHIIGDI